MTINHRDEDPVRPVLDTLLDRWQEVADAYKPDGMGGEWDDTTRRYQHYRHTYQQTIRDLRHVLDTGRIPCQLMDVEERQRGDCGEPHFDDVDEPFTRYPSVDPWGPGVNADKATTSVVALHLAQALLNGAPEVRTWARELAHELKRERIDITDDIGRHLQRLALDYPF
ncbi:hypothetical protein [Streptomyces malaysiensis]|uniref:hypothetical protein n=1 Tax=Streptomyces malaysiensis TaxID=92644 RepID=UPI0036A96F68